MKLQIIKPKFGYMAVSKEPILQGKHWWIHPETEHLGFAEENLKAPYLRVVATHTSFKFEGIPQFELEKDDMNISSLASKWAIDNADDTMATNSALNRGFIAGYKAAQEKGCYSIEDMEKAFDCYPIHSSFKDFIDSLNQPKKLVAIEVDDMEASAWVSNEKGHGRININLPIITKSEEYPDGILTVQKYYYE